MNLAEPAALRVDIGDLDGQHEMHAGVRVESPIGGFEFGLQLAEPDRMGEIAGADDGDAFDLAPPGHVLHIHLPAGGPAVLGVEVEIGDQAHAP